MTDHCWSAWSAAQVQKQTHWDRKKVLNNCQRRSTDVSIFGNPYETMVGELDFFFPWNVLMPTLNLNCEHRIQIILFPMKTIRIFCPVTSSEVLLQGKKQQYFQERLVAILLKYLHALPTCLADVCPFFRTTRKRYNYWQSIPREQ